jgi:EAL domain-containing protein (putative c-di-GMP-specific phosphodiesterase class I)
MILVPVFQPIANVATGRFVAAEALSRWHSAGEILSPLDVEAFIHWGSVDIALAKFLCGLEICYERLFINVSPETLESTMIFQIWRKSIQALVERSSIKIVIEVTENITDPQLQSRWEALSALGVELALDDFGDQHSTLERLTACPWNYCKFNAKRLSCLADYPAVMYCKKHSITAIAEQVETTAQRERAKRLGMVWQQGFRYARPAALDEYAIRTRIMP